MDGVGSQKARTKRETGRHALNYAPVYEHLHITLFSYLATEHVQNMRVGAPTQNRSTYHTILQLFKHGHGRMDHLIFGHRWLISYKTSEFSNQRTKKKRAARRVFTYIALYVNKRRAVSFGDLISSHLEGGRPGTFRLRTLELLLLK